MNSFIWFITSKCEIFLPRWELRTNLEITSISILVEISDATNCHPEHGVVCPVQTDGPGLIIPVAKGVQVDVHSSTNLRLTVKEIWSSNNEIRPTGWRNKCGDLRSSLTYSQKIMLIIILLSPILVQVCCGHRIPKGRCQLLPPENVLWHQSVHIVFPQQHHRSCVISPRRPRHEGQLPNAHYIHGWVDWKSWKERTAGGREEKGQGWVSTVGLLGSSPLWRHVLLIFILMKCVL